MSEQFGIHENLKATQGPQYDRLISQAADLLAMNDSTEKKGFTPKIGVCPECNPPLDLPQDPPEPKPQPTETPKPKQG